MQLNLFTPIDIGSIHLENRIVMAPMTRTRAQEDGTPTLMNALYYAQRASAGLIISEAVEISPDTHGIIRAPGIYTDDHIKGWNVITDNVHKEGGKIFLQLWHGGRVSHSDLLNGNLPAAPSPIAANGKIFTPQGWKEFETPRSLSKNEITQIVHDFKQAAQNAYSAGADGIELHGAFGYLVDQFLQSGTNQRHDDYGGSVQNRCRFLFEVIDALCDVWTPDRIGVKLSPSNRYYGMVDQNAYETFSYAIKGLDKAGIAYVHMMEPNENDFAAGNIQIKETTRTFRPMFNNLMITNGGYDKKGATRMIDKNYADMVSFGKLFIANPDLPNRFYHDYPLANWDQSSFYGEGEKGYTDYLPYKQAVVA